MDYFLFKLDNNIEITAQIFKIDGVDKEVGFKKKCAELFEQYPDLVKITVQTLKQETLYVDMKKGEN